MAEPPSEIVSATLRLFLNSAAGAATTNIRACRAATPWSEPFVVWFSQPPSALPCATTSVGAAAAFYEWDVTDFVQSLENDPASNFGLVLQNLNEFGFNERAFHSRQSPAVQLRPQLFVRYVRVPSGIASSFDLTATAEGDLLRLRVAPETFDTPIYEVELFFEEQLPRWSSIDVLGLPDGWSFDVVRETCETGPAQSDVLRLGTDSDPLTEENAGEFDLRVQRDDTIPTEIVQLELVGQDGQLIGRLPVSRADTPTATPTATAIPTPTTETGCCEVDGGCASGSPVTRAPCEKLGGIFFPGGDCNLETGRCDGAPAPTATRTRTPSRTPTRTRTPVPTATRSPTVTPTTLSPTVIQLDLDVFRLDGSELRDDEGGQPNDELTIGSQTCLNDDNDDQDTTFDSDDDNVPGEDDLVRIVARRPDGLIAGRVEIRQTQGVSRVRIWASSEKRTAIALPVQYDAVELPKELWVEGVAGSVAARDVEFELRLLDGSLDEPGTEIIGKPDQVALTILRVSQVAWLGKGNSLHDDDSLDADPHDPHWPGALRVFPGARAVGSAARDQVTVKVTLAVAPVEDFDLFLRAFDVDDPVPGDTHIDPNDDGSAGDYRNTTTATTDPGADTIPGGAVSYTAEEDNRGRVGGRAAGRIDGGDANGIARLTFPAGIGERDIDFQVTKQPGDNFRIGAACDRDFLVQLRNRDEDDADKLVDQSNERQIPRHDQRVSPVLTVWRRMHVERDSMGAFGSLLWWRTPNENTVTGRVTEIRATGAQCTASGLLVTILKIDQRLDGLNQYANGAIFVEGAGGFLRVDVIANSKGAAPNFLSVCGTPAGPTPARFRLHDDDDDSVLSRVPDTSWMQDMDLPANNLFAPAYVRPVFDGGGDPANDENGVTLDVNTLDSEFVAQAALGKDATGTADFWLSYIQSVFQGPLPKDRDPSITDRVVPFEGGRLGGTIDDDSLLYQETITDLARAPSVIANAASRQDIERATAVHEVGHQLNADHVDGAIMNGGWPTRAAIPRNFNEPSLNRIRCTSHPGAGTP